jgi:flavorubredoxin
LATSKLFIEDGAQVYDLAKRYFAEIMLPFRRTIEKNLDKLRGLGLRVIAPSHGPLYKQPQFIIDAYHDWVGETARNSAVIVWVSMHGSTETMVEYLTAALAERGVAVHPFNMAVSDIGRLAIELVDAATLIVACPTVHAGPHPTVLGAVHLANALRPKLRFASIVTSYGWGGQTVDIIKSLLPNLKVEFLDPVVVKGYPREKDFQTLDALAEAVAKKHGDLGLK